MTYTRRKALKAVTASSAALFAGMPALVLGQAPIRWRVQTLWGAGEDTFKYFQEFCDKLKANTGGRLEIQAFAAGAVVGAFETLDAVGQNVLQGQSTYPGYWAGKEPALAVIGDFAFGYRTPEQQNRWLYEKGGMQMLRQAYQRFGAYTVGATWWGVESLTSKRPIRKPDDFKGIKHRGAQGIAAETIAKMGASIVVLPGGEAYSALEKGIVDSVDWSTISVNAKVGFFEVAKYATFPGFHSMPIQDFTVNANAWKALPDDVKQIVDRTWREFSLTQVSRIAENDKRVAEEVKKKGVELVAWSDADLTRARQIAQTVVDEWAAKGTLAKQSAESQRAFLRELKLLA
ncbi:MAG: TRAP transporter substrate-binding protein DctP [Ramlibacter sp.]|jgi:TRAP-type mannitol/chloroaromatic compound transport system substrate-binding protein|nr:TRAP transporter substrate-binding protein DctP [Ramlibacter sp.]